MVEKWTHWRKPSTLVKADYSTFFALIIMLVIFTPLGVSLKYIAWEPKWGRQIIPWALNNLLLVAFTEELLFRALIMRRLQLNPDWQRWALPISAILFGALHFKGGPIYVLLSTLAGLFYGSLWMNKSFSWQSRLLCSLLLHFLFNLVHILLFTYPTLLRV